MADHLVVYLHHTQSWVLGCPTYLFKSPTLVENYNQDGSFLNCRDTNSFDDVKCQEDICGYYEKNVPPIFHCRASRN